MLFVGSVPCGRFRWKKRISWWVPYLSSVQICCERHLGSKHMVSQEVPKGRVREAGHNVIVWIHRPWLNALKMKASKEMFIDMEIFSLEPEHDFCWLFIFHQVTGGLKNWKSHHSSHAPKQRTRDERSNSIGWRCGWKFERSCTREVSGLVGWSVWAKVTKHQLSPVCILPCDHVPLRIPNLMNYDAPISCVKSFFGISFNPTT